MEEWHVKNFTDIRAIQTHIKDEGLGLVTEVDAEENPHGPGSFTLRDPDGKHHPRRSVFLIIPTGYPNKNCVSIFCKSVLSEHIIPLKVPCSCI